MLALEKGITVDDRYEIVETIGSGGFGNVYKARQKQFDRDVAIKLLSTNVLEEADGLPRFEREAKAISGLKHKNIVAFYGYGVWNHAPYMVMELIEGTSLQSLLRSHSKLDPLIAARIMKQVCDGLSCAHANGVVHRDLKPSNIMLEPGPDGREVVKLIDFGLVKLMPGYGVPNQKLTEAGCAVGTCHYMSPEQCVGGDTDHRVDIYATACILYQVLTGELPFQAEDQVAIMFQHINDAPKPLAAHISPTAIIHALQAVVEKGMAKDPGDRYQSAVDMSADLDSILRGESGKLAHQGRTSQRMFLPTSAARQAKKQLKWLIPALAAIASACFVLYQMTMLSGNPTATTADTTSLSLYDEISKRARSESAGQMLPELERTIEENKHDQRLDSQRLASIYHRLGDAYLQKGRYDEALTSFRHAEDLWPIDKWKEQSGWKVISGQAVALNELHRYQEARLILENLLKNRQANHFSNQAMQYATLPLAQALVGCDKQRLAEEALVKATSVPMQDADLRADLLEALGQVRIAMRAYANAHDAYEELLTNCPPSRRKRTMLGLLRIALFQEHYDDAKRYFAELEPLLSPDQQQGTNILLLRLNNAAGHKDRAAADRIMKQLEAVPYEPPQDGFKLALDHEDGINTCKVLYEAGWDDLVEKVMDHMHARWKL